MSPGGPTSSAQQRPAVTAQEVRALLAAARADVLAALERGKSLPLQELTELRRTIQEAIGAYEALRAAEPSRQEELEMTLGRQVIDLRRQAALLPQMESGRAVPPARDRVASGQPFIESRPPPEWALRTEPPPPRDDQRRLSPGDEVDAWCGPCGGLRTHAIVALVGDQPKQVVCQSCGARHGYRLTPARGRSEDGAPRPVRATTTRRTKTAEELQEERRLQELAALRRELEAAVDVIAFDPRRRYRTGEIIEHPEYGRGKVETALKTTIVVRFGTGRRSLLLR
ncbi:MAG: hypothetical protein RMK29_14770 [Myxococcales bacterium]|nr:hypothetical protein [Myxococcota bacterium]MDW8282976.1 hypothetical protein [Myxococcales bacterium]